MGRQRELFEVSRRLRQPGVRLVTIVGRSGLGKTRLAIETAHREAADWPGGAAFVDLSGTDDAGLIHDLVASALGTRAAPGTTAEEAIRARLRHAPSLLVVDEIDRVPGAADVLLDLTSASPESRLLGTVHRPLRIPDETVVRLAPLATPDTDTADPAALADVGSVALYVQRVAAVDPMFDLATSDLQAVAELCRRLDGLPLAIELAATRAGIMPPAAQLAAIVDHTALDLRSSRGSDRPARQRDVRSAVAASHDLAGEHERIVLRRMAVFATACTSAMLQAVAAEPGWTLADILDALVELVDLGLVEVDPGDQDPRYRLPPTVRDFGREQLEAAGELESIQRRHEDALMAAAARARHLAEGDQLRAIERDDAELHAVFARAVTDGRTSDALALAADLAPLWSRRGFFAGPRAAFDQVLEAADEHVDPGLRARALLWWVRLQVDQPAGSRDRERIVRRLGQGVELAQASGDSRLWLFALETVVLSVFVTGDIAAAAQATAEGAALAAAVGDEGARIRFDYRLAMLAGRTGKFEEAARFGASAFERALATGDVRSMVRSALILVDLPPDTAGLPDPRPNLEVLVERARAAGELGDEGHLYTRIARNAFVADDWVAAADWTLRGLDFAARYGAWHSSAYLIAKLVTVAARDGDDTIAARLHGTLTPLMTEVIVGLSPGPAAEYLAAVDAAKARLGAERFDRLVAEGMLLGPDDSIALASEYARRLGAIEQPSPRHRPIVSTATASPPPTALTPRELDILRELATGATNRQIADRMGLRPKTVMHHSVSIYSKLGLRSRTEAAAWAYREGLLN